MSQALLVSLVCLMILFLPFFGPVLETALGLDTEAGMWYGRGTFVTILWPAGCYKKSACGRTFEHPFQSVLMVLAEGQTSCATKS